MLQAALKYWIGTTNITMLMTLKKQMNEFKNTLAVTKHGCMYQLNEKLMELFFKPV